MRSHPPGEILAGGFSYNRCRWARVGGMTVADELRRRAKWRVALVFTFILVAVGWYAWARTAAPRSTDAELVVSISGYGPGTVRRDGGVWIARQPSGQFYVFLDRDPHRGQPLQWVEAQGMFMQAASYGIDGVCRQGPCDPSPGQGLYRVESRLEGEHLIVHPQRVISGGFNPEPSWVTDLKHFVTRRQPTAP